MISRPTPINLDELKQAIEREPTTTQTKMTNTLGCTQHNILYLFRKLRLVSKADQWTPHELTLVQKQKRVEICNELISKRRRFDWLDHLVTGDENWVLHVNIERKEAL